MGSLMSVKTHPEYTTYPEFIASSNSRLDAAFPSPTISTPFGAQQGDLLVATVAGDSGGGTLTSTTGWTTAGSATSGSDNVLVYYRFITSSELTASYAFTRGTMAIGVCALTLYRGVSSVSATTVSGTGGGWVSDTNYGSLAVFFRGYTGFNQDMPFLTPVTGYRETGSAHRWPGGYVTYETPYPSFWAASMEMSVTTGAWFGLMLYGTTSHSSIIMPPAGTAGIQYVSTPTGAGTWNTASWTIPNNPGNWLIGHQYLANLTLSFSKEWFKWGLGLSGNVSCWMMEITASTQARGGSAGQTMKVNNTSTQSHLTEEYSGINPKWPLNSVLSDISGTGIRYLPTCTLPAYGAAVCFGGVNICNATPFTNTGNWDRLTVANRWNPASFTAIKLGSSTDQTLAANTYGATPNSGTIELGSFVLNGA